MLWIPNLGFWFKCAQRLLKHPLWACYCCHSSFGSSPCRDSHLNLSASMSSDKFSMVEKSIHGGPTAKTVKIAWLFCLSLTHWPLMSREFTEGAMDVSSLHGLKKLEPQHRLLAKAPQLILGKLILVGRCTLTKPVCSVLSILRFIKLKKEGRSAVVSSFRYWDGSRAFPLTPSKHSCVAYHTHWWFEHFLGEAMHACLQMALLLICVNPGL